MSSSLSQCLPVGYVLCTCTQLPGTSSAICAKSIMTVGNRCGLTFGNRCAKLGGYVTNESLGAKWLRMHIQYMYCMLLLLLLLLLLLVVECAVAR